MKKSTLSSFVILNSAANLIFNCNAQVSNYNNDHLTIVYEFSHYDLSKSQCERNNVVNLPGFNKMKGSGIPALPQKIEKFEIHEGMNIKGIDFEVLCDTIDIEYELAEPLLLMGEKKPDNTQKLNADLEADAFWPSNWGYIVGSQYFRDIQLGNIAITPVRYNSLQKKAIICKQLKVNVNFESSSKYTKAKAKSTIKHSRVSEIMNGVISMPLEESNGTHDVYNSSDSYSLTSIKAPLNPILTYSPLYYLIISPEEFSAQAERLAAWKRRMGYNVEVKTAKKEYLKTPGYTKQLIESSYQAQPNLEYVLLLGDGDQIKPYNGINSYDYRVSYYTDYYFGCMDNDDYMTDLFIGRLPARDLAEAEIMVSKTIEYEQNPPINNYMYFQNGLNSAFFEDSGCTELFDESEENWGESLGWDCTFLGMEAWRHVRSSEDISNYLQSKGYIINKVYRAADTSYPMRWSNRYSEGEMIPKSLQKPNFSWNGGKDDTVSQINEGRFYIFYSWHGENTKWGVGGALFLENSDVSRLTNAGAYPVIFSSTCLSGGFYHKPGVQNEGRSLSETLLAKDNGGSAGIIAFSDKCFTEITDMFNSGIFDAIYPNPGLVWNSYSDAVEANPSRTPVKELAKIMFLANERAFQAYADFNPNPNSPTIISRYFSQSLYNREVAHCLADPSLKIMTQRPKRQQISKSEANGSHLYVDPRNLVAVNKQTNEVLYIKGPIREFLDPYMNDYYLSFVADDYIPTLLNEEEGLAASRNISIKSISCNGQDIQISFEEPIDVCTVTITDLSGNVIKSV